MKHESCIKHMPILQCGLTTLLASSLLVAQTPASASGPQTSQLPSEGKHIMVLLGYASSPVLGELKTNHQLLDGRTLAHTAVINSGGNDDKAAKLDLIKTLKKADALLADLSEIDPSDEDKLLVEAAEDSEIPVIFENVTAGKMAEFFGLGTDNPLVVAEYDAHLRQGKLTPSDPAKGVGARESPDMENLRTFDSRLALAKNIIATRPFTHGAHAQAVAGYCSATNAAGQPLFTGTTCQEWSFTPQPMTFYPYYRSIPWVLNGTAFVDAELDFGLYQVGAYKYMVLRTAGGWGISYLPNSHEAPIENQSEVFPFFRDFEITMNPTNMVNTSWHLDRVAPANPNNNSSLTVTTGWTVTGGATLSSTPGADLSASYSQSNASTINVSDWTAQTNSMSPIADWKYYMSATTDCNGNVATIGLNDSLLKMTSFCWESGNYVNTPPVWSMSGNQYSGAPLSEAVYLTSQAGTLPTINLQYQLQAAVEDVWITNDHYFTYTENSETTTESLGFDFTINPNIVHN